MNRGMASGIRGRTRDRVVAVAAAAGVVIGLASTYPRELGPAASLPAWALVGVPLGMLVGRAGRILASGTSYGVFLTLAFLYSRFGGSAHDLPAYTLFVLAMSIGGAMAGVITVFVGSRLLARS